MPSHPSDAKPSSETFNRTKIAVVIGLFVLLVVCAVLFWNTRDAMAQLPFLRAKARNAATAQNTLVDLRPWQTAQELAPMAVSAEETEYAHETERLADHEVDQAFALALRQAQTKAQHRALTGDALALSQKAAQLQQLVNQDQARVQSLPAAPAGGAASDDLEIAKAQLGLDTDQLNDAQQDLARALGDERARIQQELNAHEASMKKYDAEVATKGQAAVANSRNYGTLAKRLDAWLDQRNRQQLIDAAARQADADALTLTASHNQVESQSSPSVAENASDTAARLKNLKTRSMHSQMLSLFDDRIQTQQQLAAVYRKWSIQVSLQHRIMFHLLMESLALLILVILGGLLLDAVIRQFLDHRHIERRRLNTLKIISRLVIQIVTALLVLLVIFGTPSEMPTIVGLTTAGLTVVLQDFIVSICGWFVLMGKNGVRIGDWVEINGVGGEVVEVGLFRTVLLETGNWTDHGHPTGRRVTLMNSFAIKGQYFNFSTSGQWMWDELTVNIPVSEDPYATVELIHKAVIEETESESRIAEQEWMRLGRSHGLSQFTAAPAVNLRPGASGIDILVRYVTRASNRYDVRNRLYQRVIELLHKSVAQRS